MAIILLADYTEVEDDPVNLGFSLTQYRSLDGKPHFDGGVYFKQKYDQADPIMHHTSSSLTYLVYNYVTKYMKMHPAFGNLFMIASRNEDFRKDMMQQNGWMHVSIRKNISKIYPNLTQMAGYDYECNNQIIALTRGLAHHALKSPDYALKRIYNI